MLEQILDIARSLATKHTFLCYIFVFFISYLESFAFVGLIMPGAGFAFFVGLMAYHGVFNILYLMCVGSLGAFLADISSFFLAKFFRDKNLFLKIKEKYGTYIKKGEDFFEKYGGISVLFGRFVGFLRPVIPFVAGLLNMNISLFMFYSIISGILWGISYFGSGYLFGMGISHVKFNYIKILLLVLFIGFFIYKIIKRKDKKG